MFPVKEDAPVTVASLDTVAPPMDTAPVPGTFITTFAPCINSSALAVDGTLLRMSGPLYVADVDTVLNMSTRIGVASVSDTDCAVICSAAHNMSTYKLMRTATPRPN
jgi:hypothetical protein